MVATRRAAQPAVEDELAMDDPELALKKKPARKAPVKSAKAATKTNTKPKPTRGKKTEPEPEVQQDEMEDVQPAKSKRQAAGRPKKDSVPEPALEEAAVAKKLTRNTKVGSVRDKKAVAIVEDDVPALAVEEPKPTRATKAGSVRGRKAPVAADPEPVIPAPEPTTTRTAKTGSLRGKRTAATVDEAPALPPPEEPKPTRSTRTTASKAPPLSPKKITQVSKPATRTTRNATQKPAAKAAPVTAAPKSRGSTRKRTESNENADPDENDVEMAYATPVKVKATRGRAKKQGAVAESETSMGPRPTTPNDTATNSFSQDNDGVDELQQGIEAGSAVSKVAYAASETSDDELCGPKTPMKRSSPGAATRYRESVQRTIRKYEADINMETPARRFAVLGSQRGTPQTQKPYCKPIPPTSDARPMTVFRGADRAFVFRDIRTGAPNVGNYHEIDEDADELSFIPDDDIIPIDEDTAEPTPTPAYSSRTDALLDPNIEMEDVDFVPNVVPEEDEEAYITPSLVEPDPEETVLIHDTSSRAASPDQDPVGSFETEDTVIIHGSFTAAPDEDMSDDASDTDSGSVVHLEDTPAEPFVANGTPIAVNFDDHLADAHVSPQKTLMESIDIINAQLFTTSHEEHATVGAEMELDRDVVIPELSSRRQTVNLNEFIEASALSEPTIALEDTFEVVNTESVDLMEVEDFEQAVVPSDLAEKLPVVEMENVQPAMMDVGEATLKDKPAASELQPQSEQLEADATKGQTLEEQHVSVPHYALPTIAFDARRKSLPVLSLQTPVNVGARPNTSDGGSMPRMANPFTQEWWNRRNRPSQIASPGRIRPGTAHGVVSRSTIGTPVKTSKAATPAVTPGERFPRLAARNNYEDHSKTAAPPARFHIPSKQFPNRRQTFHKAMRGRINTKSVEAAASPVCSPVASPQVTPGERYPRLQPRDDYAEHAKTVAAPVRFKTPPARSPLKRPATTQKSDALRRVALTATSSHTSMRTPLKDPAMTPAQAPMTPHPAAPLRGVVAMVEVYTLEGASASAPFVALLHRLGAKTARSMSDKVTHVIFKDGSPTTLQRVRINNKQVDETGKGAYIHCVNSRWVTDCDTEGLRKDETDEEYFVDVAEVPRGGKRRRKSMEPSALKNIGGNIVRDRKTSLGRASIGRSSSFGRSPFKTDSPAKEPQPSVIETPKMNIVEKENSGDEQSSPVTPAWIAAPGQLVQQTAPINRVRKLELQGGKEPKNRRLTFWNGGA